MKCVICSRKITTDPDGWDGGHNAEPIVEGRCCGMCNDIVVTPTRFLEFSIKNICKITRR